MLELWVDWVMDQMKGRKAFRLHFTWVELWVQDLVLVDQDSLHHSQELEMTYSQALVAANNINLVGSKSKILRFYTQLSHFHSFFVCRHYLDCWASRHCGFCSYIFLTLLWFYIILTATSYYCVSMLFASDRLQHHAVPKVSGGTCFEL